MKKTKSIPKATLTRLINKAGGDWDFLLFLLEGYWKAAEESKDE